MGFGRGPWHATNASLEWEQVQLLYWVVGHGFLCFHLWHVASLVEGKRCVRCCGRCGGYGDGFQSFLCYWRLVNGDDGGVDATESASVVVAEQEKWVQILG